MLTIKKRAHLVVIFFIFALTITLKAYTSEAGTGSNTYYSSLPFTTSSSAAPNIMMVLDYSGSMSTSAYPDYFEKSTSKYYGYFDSNKYYSYSAAGEKFIPKANDCSTNKIGTKDCISGNYLNWISMSRLDVLRKALIGGSGKINGDKFTLSAEGNIYNWGESRNIIPFPVEDYYCRVFTYRNRSKSNPSYRSYDLKMAIYNYGIKENCDGETKYNDDFEGSSLNSKWTVEDINLASANAGSTKVTSGSLFVTVKASSLPFIDRVKTGTELKKVTSGGSSGSFGGDGSPSTKTATTTTTTVDVWGKTGEGASSSDNFTFIYQTVPRTDRYDMRIHIKSLPVRDGKIVGSTGLMIRESLDKGSRYYAAMVIQESPGKVVLQVVQRTETDKDATKYYFNYDPVDITEYYNNETGFWIRFRDNTSKGDYFHNTYAEIRISKGNIPWNKMKKIGRGFYMKLTSDNLLVGIATASPDAEGGTAEIGEIKICTKGADCTLGTLSNANMDVDIPLAERRGIVQKITDKDNDGKIDDGAPRFGVTVYSREKREKVQDPNSSAYDYTGAITEDWRGCVKVGISNSSAFSSDSNVQTVVSVIEKMHAIGGTDTAAGLYEAIDYLKQQDKPRNGESPCNNPFNMKFRDGSGYSIEGNSSFIELGSAKDPMYDANMPVFCRKCSILLVSDGVWNGGQFISSAGGAFNKLSGGGYTKFTGSGTGSYDFKFIDPVKAALDAHTGDFRKDPGMDGEQSIDIYSVYIFSNNNNGRLSMQNVAMFGGFTDSDGNGYPYPYTNVDGNRYPADSTKAPIPTCTQGDDRCLEWDQNRDNIPDNYFEANEGNKLEEVLFQAINKVYEKVASSTAVSMMTSSGEGEGAVYQAYYLAKKDITEPKKKTVEWIGHLKAFWVDRGGFIHEDSVNNNNFSVTLDFPEGNDSTGGDKIIDFKFDKTTGETVAYRYNFTDTNKDGVPEIKGNGGKVNMNNLTPIFDAGKMLALRDAGTRKIYTSLDDNEDGKCDTQPCPTSFTSGDFREFNTSNANLIAPYIDVPAGEEVNIINFIRGEQIKDSSGKINTNYRDRSFIVDGSEVVWKLGDIVSSTPVTSGIPADRFDIHYGDSSYSKFYKKYKADPHGSHKDRQTVIYVGANDGMIHAFNGGIFKPSDGSAGNKNGRFESVASLGEEMWAYIPYDLLPHLKWLAKPNYKHVFYADSSLHVQDAKVFPCNDSRYVGESGDKKCWGTMLIATMRTGGGELTIDNFKKTFDTAGKATGKARSFRSSIFALDITDPSQPPRFMWRFNCGIKRPNPSATCSDDNDLGFTTSSPAVAKIGSKWVLVAGSGSSVNYSNVSEGYRGKSSRAANIFILNLETGELENTFPLKQSKAFISDIVAIDADQYRREPDGSEYSTDVAYAGMTFEKASAKGSKKWKGMVERIPLENSSGNPEVLAPSTLFETSDNQAITSPVSVISRGVNKTALHRSMFVGFGTGRFNNENDRKDKTQQSFYTIIDNCWDMNGTTGKYSFNVTKSCSNKKPKHLHDVTKIKVDQNGILSGASETTFSQLKTSYENDFMSSKPGKFGWFIDLNKDNSKAERVLTAPLLLGDLTLFSSYTPNNEICGFGGNGSIYALSLTTGLPYYYDGFTILGFDSNGNAMGSISLGSGKPSTPVVHAGRERGGEGSALLGGKGATVYVQASSGAFGKKKSGTSESRTPLVITPPNASSGIISWSDSPPVIKTGTTK